MEDEYFLETEGGPQPIDNSLIDLNRSGNLRLWPGYTHRVSAPHSFPIKYHKTHRPPPGYGTKLAILILGVKGSDA